MKFAYLLGMSVLLLSACASTNPTNSTIASNHEEVEYSLGSNIPHHVKPAASADPTTTVTDKTEIQRTFDNLTHQMPVNRSGQ